MAITLSSLLKSGILPVNVGGTGTSSSTGTGSLVLSTSPNILTSLTTTSTSFDLLNTSALTVNFAGAATTVNFAGAATSLNIGSSSGNTVFNNNVAIQGNLTVNGTTTTVNSTTISVDDKNIELGSVDFPSDSTANMGGITLKGTTNKTIVWNMSTGAWTSNVPFVASSIQDTPIGSSTPSTGKFTDISIEDGEIRLYEDPANGSNYISIKSPTSILNTYSLELPNEIGNTGQLLSVNSAGALEFVNFDQGGNRIFVSAKFGNDANNGISQPVKTIKRAMQIAASLVYTSAKVVNGSRVTVQLASGDYSEDNPIIVPDFVILIGDSLRSCIVRPLNAHKDMFRVRNGCYMNNFTFRDGVNALGVPSFTWDYAIAFDDVADTTASRVGYTNLPTSKSIMTLSPYILTVSILSFLGGNGCLVDGNKVSSPNVPDNISEVELNPAGIAPVQCKSMIGSAFTMVSFGGTGWRIINDAYVQLVSCFQLFLLNGVYTQSGGYASITNSATNFGKYALRSSGYSPYAFTFDKGFVASSGSTGTSTTITSLGTTREGGPVNEFVIRFRSNNELVYKVDVCQRDIGYVIDAIGYDMMFNCNFRSVKAAMSYFEAQASLVIGAQRAATVDAFTYLKNYLINNIGGDPVLVASVSDNMDIIINLVRDGSINGATGLISPLPTIVMPSPPTITAGFANAAVLIAANKSFLQAEISAYMASTFTSVWSSLSDLQKNKCTRDIGYIIDAIQYDILTGGNLETIVAARAYYSFGTFVELAAEKPAALAVQLRLRDIIEYIITNNTSSWTKSTGNTAIQQVNLNPASTDAVIFAKARFQEIRDTINSGNTPSVITPSTAWASAVSIAQYDMLDTDKSAIAGFVTDFINNNPLYASTDVTSTYKLQSSSYISVSFNATTAVTLSTEVPPSVFTFSSPHGFLNNESVTYNSNGNVPLGGLFTGSDYYIAYISPTQFKLAQDEGLSILIDITSLSIGTHSFTKQDYELCVDSVVQSHNKYQTLTLISNAFVFTTGQVIEGTVSGSPTRAYVYKFTAPNTLIVSIDYLIPQNGSTPTQTLFIPNSRITKAGSFVINVLISSVSLRTDLYTNTFSIKPTITGGGLQNVTSLIGKKIFFHRPSVVNSSGHTWEYAGSGIDYNALPQNGGQTVPAFEQVQELAGRVYTSGTNELGDFKVGNFITAYNRTGNITFKNRVDIQELSVLKLSFSDIAISSISTDIGLGENEISGPSNNTLSTQLATWSYLQDRLGDFIDKGVSTNSIPGAIVQLNSVGQINTDLIPPQRTVTSVVTYGYSSRLRAADDIPAVEFLAGDTSSEEYQSISVSLSSLVTASDGDIVVQANTNAIGIIKGNYVDSSVLIIASDYDTFKTPFTTTSSLDTLTIGYTITTAYCMTISAVANVVENHVLRTTNVSQYVILPNTSSYSYTISSVAKILRYNNVVYVTTAAPHGLTLVSYIKTTSSIAEYNGISYPSIISTTRFKFNKTGVSTTSTTFTAYQGAIVNAAVNSTTTTGTVTSSNLTGTINNGDYVFGGDIPPGSIITNVNMGVNPREFTITFPELSSIPENLISTLTFITPINATGTVRSIITAVNNHADGEVTELKSGVITTVNNLTIVGGSSYVSGTYIHVPLTSSTGTGSGAVANITVTLGSVTTVDITYGGIEYAIDDILSASNTYLGGTGSLFNVKVSSVETRVYLDIISGVAFIGSEASPDFVADNLSITKTLTLTDITTKSFNATSIDIGGDVNYVLNQITIVGHGLSTGDSITYDSSFNPPISGLIALSYFVKKISNDVIELYTDYTASSANKIIFGSSSSGIHFFYLHVVNLDNDRFYAPAHGITNGTAVTITGSSLPSSYGHVIPDRETFFVGSVTTNTFTLHTLRSDALQSINGSIIAAINITAIGSGTCTFITDQVNIIGVINTSSRVASSWGLIATSSIDAANIISGVIDTTRLAVSGTANSNTFLRGDSSWSPAVSSIQSTNAALTITGSGTGAKYGAVTVDIVSVDKTGGVGLFSTLGAASFNTTQFSVGTGDSLLSGQVQLKNGILDAGTLDSHDSTYFLDPTNFSAAIPVSKGGTDITTYTTGDILYASGSAVLSKLAIGANGAILTVSSNVPAWVNVLPATHGGTGLSSAGTAGNVLTSDGTTWTSAPLNLLSQLHAYSLAYTGI